MSDRRSIAKLAGCPKCGVGPGVACTGGRGIRRAVHQERIKHAASLPVLPPAPVRPPKPSVGFYASDEWRRVRYDALKLHGGRCQCCGAAPTRDAPLHVDHIKPRSRFPELELALDNLQVLCAACNLGKGARDQTDWRRA
jgi:5-methylcytosine-specific restriction endonuclease McrA